MADNVPTGVGKVPVPTAGGGGFPKFVDLGNGYSIVYTDAWTSMGQEAETEERRDAFRAYQVNDALLDAAGPDAVAMTIESDGASIYPVVYVRHEGRIEEHALDPDPLHDFEGLPYRRDLGAILDRLTAGASAA